MKSTLCLVICVLASCLAMPVAASVNSPVHLVVDKTARISDVLTLLAQKTEVPILMDDTIIDTINASDFRVAGVEPVLNALASSDPGLIWRRLYVPQAGALPTGEAMEESIRAMKPGTKSGLIYDSPTPNSVVSFVIADHRSAIAPPKGMRVAYLVTNPKIRVMRLTEKEAANTKARQALMTPLELAMEAINNASSAFQRMTPAEQQAALPALRQMLDNMDPAIKKLLLPPAVADNGTPNAVDNYLNSQTGVRVNRNGTLISGGNVNILDLANQSVSYGPAPGQ